MLPILGFKELCFVTARLEGNGRYNLCFLKTLNVLICNKGHDI